tara:strand:- start:1175 stop:1384 length:210 start_codon:yes stop_codon:yes gene_type:complete
VSTAYISLIDRTIGLIGELFKVFLNGPTFLDAIGLYAVFVFEKLTKFEPIRDRAGVLVLVLKPDREEPA